MTTFALDRSYTLIEISPNGLSGRTMKIIPEQDFEITAYTLSIRSATTDQGSIDTQAIVSGEIHVTFDAERFNHPIHMDLNVTEVDVDPAVTGDITYRIEVDGVIMQTGLLAAEETTILWGDNVVIFTDPYTFDGGGSYT